MTIFFSSFKIICDAVLNNEQIKCIPGQDITTIAKKKTARNTDQSRAWFWNLTAFVKLQACVLKLHFLLSKLFRHKSVS